MELSPVYKKVGYRDEVINAGKRIPKHNISLTQRVVKAVAWFNGGVVLTVLLSLIKGANYSEISEIITLDVLSAIGISIGSIIISVTIVVAIGIPVAYVLATREEKRYRYLESLICLPIILPPTVAGLALLMTFGKRGIIGQYLNLFGITIPFTFLAVIIVQIFTISPYFIQIVKNEFQTIDKSIIEAAKVCGAGESELILKIYTPIARRSIASGIILGGLRGLGEFGATMMFAGNMVGKTQTITLRIYSLYQLDVSHAVTLAVLQLVIVIFFLGILKFLGKRLEH